VWRAGDTIALGKGRRPHSGWRLSVPPLEEIELEPFVQWLVDKLPRKLDFSSVTPTWEAQISFSTEITDETPAVLFRVDTLRRVGQFGANLDIDLYVGGE
jgi:uncharacterized protein DUF4279